MMNQVSISKETLVSRKEIMKGRVLHVTVDTVSIDDGQGGEKSGLAFRRLRHPAADQ